MANQLSKMFGSGLKKSAFSLAVVSGVGMVAIVVIIVASVAMRQFFNAPLYFTEEIVGLLMSVSLFLALPLVTLQSGHIRVSILIIFLKKHFPKNYTIVSSLASLVGIVFCAWLIIEALPWLEFAIKHNLKTETARILLYPAMLALPVSIFLMALIFAARLIGWIASDEAAHSISEPASNHPKINKV